MSRPRDVRPGSVLAILVTASLLSMSGCAAPTAPAQDAARTIDQLGAVPVPPSPGLPRPLPALPAHPQLLTIGDPISATLPNGATATVTALGPQPQPTPNPPTPAGRVRATITIRAENVAGYLELSPTDFTVRDDHGRSIPLRGAGPVVASTNQTTATLNLACDLYNGSAQITWHPAGATLALWTFNTELD